MSRPAISVVITAHNEAGAIGTTLAALARQSLAPGVTAEVVLVDDRSDDGTLAEAIAAGHPAMTILEATPDPASPLTTRQQALALGFGAARGRVIVTCDADSRMAPDWLMRLAGPILSEQVAAVAGPIGFWPANRPIGAWQGCDAAWYFSVCAVLARLGLSTGVFFGNFAFRADLWQATGGFAAIGPALTEDLAFARALAARGVRIRPLDGGARVEVRAAPSVAALVARTRRVARGPVSVLALVLALWPLSLIVLALAALAGVPGAAAALGWRYGLGAGLVALAVLRHGNRGAVWFAPFYEPAVPLMALAVALGGRGIDWGGRRYD